MPGATHMRIRFILRRHFPLESHLFCPQLHLCSSLKEALFLSQIMLIYTSWGINDDFQVNALPIPKFQLSVWGLSSWPASEPLMFPDSCPQMFPTAFCLPLNITFPKDLSWPKHLKQLPLHAYKVFSYLFMGEADGQCLSYPLTHSLPQPELKAEINSLWSLEHSQSPPNVFSTVHGTEGAAPSIGSPLFSHPPLSQVWWFQIATHMALKPKTLFRAIMESSFAPSEPMAH